MKILIAIGTRPEAIKLAPLVSALQKDGGFEVEVCATAQHREMLDQVFALFDITPDYDLDVMTPNQTLASLTAKIVSGFDEILVTAKPDVVVVQGDTTTTLACALASFYRRIDVAHVEAGLRTGDRFSPFPEEINRRLTSSLTKWHLIPTEKGRTALLAENYAPDSLHVVGNTVIDALTLKIAEVRANPEPYLQRFDFISDDRRMVLVTCHRRENFGGGLENICAAVRQLADKYPDIIFVYPVHLNPNIQNPVGELLGKVDNIRLIEPQDYLNFIWLLDRAHLVLTDSGGVQEEAPTLGTPVVVMRDTTERQEAIESGSAVLVGSETDEIVKQASKLLDDKLAWAAMANVDNPFGDGRACEYIIDVIKGK